MLNFPDKVFISIMFECTIMIVFDTKIIFRIQIWLKFLIFAKIKSSSISYDTSFIYNKNNLILYDNMKFMIIHRTEILNSKLIIEMINSSYIKRYLWLNFHWKIYFFLDHKKLNTYFNSKKIKDFFAIKTIKYQFVLI